MEKGPARPSLVCGTTQSATTSVCTATMTIDPGWIAAGDDIDLQFKKAGSSSYSTVKTVKTSGWQFEL
ncbi:hypothetical protein ABZZ47_29460 [Streptomyces sp. NPDC006465]|uniref:hypothetical protein n=1 Tax=Streptomyces sp. NPDC006465 TaxID=3157174 RepID=UPI0033BC5D7D